MIFDFNAVAALAPTVNGVDMSFLPNGGARMPTASAVDDDSSSSADSIGSDDDDTSDSSDDDDDDNSQPPDDAPTAKRTRRVLHERHSMKDSAWWHYFLSPEAKAELLADADCKLARQFRQAFRVPYFVFKVKSFEYTVAMWWPDGWYVCWRSINVFLFMFVIIVKYLERGRVVDDVDSRVFRCNRGRHRMIAIFQFVIQDIIPFWYSKYQKKYGRGAVDRNVLQTYGHAP